MYKQIPLGIIQIVLAGKFEFGDVSGHDEVLNEDKLATVVRRASRFRQRDVKNPSSGHDGVFRPDRQGQMRTDADQSLL
jgi:hypothetical protein